MQHSFFTTYIVSLTSLEMSFCMTKITFQFHWSPRPKFSRLRLWK